MQKTTENIETVTTKKTTVYCDDCGEPTVTMMACNRKNCEMCGADLCKNCIGHEEYDTGDYRTVYCKDCWSVGEGFRERIAMINREIEVTEDDWKSACKRIRAAKALPEPRVKQKGWEIIHENTKANHV